MIKKSWEEFKKTGLLWFTNTILHLFGWAIVISIEDGKVTEAYPARVNFRGFPENVNTMGYIKVTKYLQENICDLLEEAKDEQEQERRYAGDHQRNV